MPYGKRDGVAFKEVLVLKAPLLTCLTCPLCDYLLREATTISECLHTFCRECITAELSHGESECCPVCQVSLGTLPLEKLRADHQLNDLKEKLFPSNAKKRKPDVLAGSPRTSNVNASRRKERSLYSLGVKGPPAVNPGYASRKTRALPGTHGSSEPSSMDEELEDEGDDDDEEDISHDSPTTILKLSSHSNGGSRRASPDGGPDAKVYPHSEPRRRPEVSALTPRADGEHPRAASNTRPWTTSKVSHRQPQTVANGHNNASGSVAPGPRDISKYVRGSRKSNGVAIRAPAARVGEFPSALDALAQVADADAAMVETGSGPPSPSPPDLRTPGSTKSVLGRKNSKEIVLAIAGSSLQAGQTNSPFIATTNGPSLQSRLKETLSGVMFRPSIIRNPRPMSCPRAGSQSLGSSTSGIWFHLEAGDVQASEDALPPLSSPFVRIKDVKLPVYHVKSYLVLKLAHKVRSEMEVEITCRGQPVVSSLPLESIRDIWFSAQISDQPQPQAQGQAQPQGETSAAYGNGNSNAQAEFPTSKDFLMVLTYRRHRKPRIN